MQSNKYSLLDIMHEMRCIISNKESFQKLSVLPHISLVGPQEKYLVIICVPRRVKITETFFNLKSTGTWITDKVSVFTFVTRKLRAKCVAHSWLMSTS